MPNRSTIKRLFSMAFVLNAVFGLILLMILFPGPYIFVFIVIGILLLGIGFIRSVSDQDRIERKYLLKQLASQSTLVIENNAYYRATGQYGNRQAQFDLISRSDNKWDVYDMQLMIAVRNERALKMVLLQERESKKENEDDKFQLRFEVAATPDSIYEVLFTETALRQSLLQVDRGVELTIEENTIWLKQPLNEEIDYILHLFNLLCQVAEQIEQME